jgi:hypothetical protein
VIERNVALQVNLPVTDFEESAINITHASASTQVCIHPFVRPLDAPLVSVSCESPKFFATGQNGRTFTFPSRWLSKTRNLKKLNSGHAQAGFPTR